jgi:hypothetical protein
MPAAPRKAEKNDEKPEPVTPAEAAAAEAVPDEEKDDTILVPFPGCSTYSSVPGAPA